MSGGAEKAGKDFLARLPFLHSPVYCLSMEKAKREQKFQKQAPPSSRRPGRDPILWVLLALALILFSILMGMLLTRKNPLPVPQRLQGPVELSGKSWDSFGDSITDHGFWQPLVLQDIPLEHRDHGISGSCVCGPGLNPFWSEERITALIADQPDIITIMGGTNDFFSAYPIGGVEELSRPLEEKDRNSFLGAYAYLVERLQAALPECKIFIMSTPQNYFDFQLKGPEPNQAGLKTADYAKACRKIAEHYGCGFIDVFGIPYKDDQAFMADHDDGIHPNGSGAAKIAVLVSSAFQAYSEGR